MKIKAREIKLAVTPKPKKELTYPCIMRFKNGEELVVWFVSSDRGMALVDESVPSRLFELQDGWYPATNSDKWEPFEGKIEIEVSK